MCRKRNSARGALSLSPLETSDTIAAWRNRLYIEQEIRAERLNRFHCTDELGRPGCSLVGVVYEGCTAVIYHTRALTEHDIVHELLHVRYPYWTEERVKASTDRLLRRAYRHATSSGGRQS